MPLTDSIDTALQDAAAQTAAPFRINLKDEQIEGLKVGGALTEPVGPITASPGAYGGVNVYPTLGAVEVLAQPGDRYPALHIQISS